MIGLKRFVRPEFVFSVAAHVGILLLGLLLFGAEAVRPAPPEPMTVELVPPSEAPPFETTPQVEGTPLDSTSTGSEVSSDSKTGSATAERPRPKTAEPSLEQAQTRSNPQHSASLAAALPQPAPPEDPQPETQPQASEPILPPSTPTTEPQPSREEATKQPNVGEMFAMPLALPGGRLGGGFDAPASNPAMLPHDDTAAFRARVSSCSHLPPDIAVDEKVMILLRVSFKRDGTLARRPELLDASYSPKTLELLQTAIGALEKCQPYPELPADKYQKWKTLDLTVTPRALSRD
jgi:hypothetical protein